MSSRSEFTTYRQTTRFLNKEEFKQYLTQCSFKLLKTRNDVFYYNVSCVIDLESSSFYYNQEKTAIMYCGTIGINGSQFLFRTYDELLEICNFIQERFGLCKTKRMIFYVHNLSFDFQFLRTHFNIESLFALSQREPVKVNTEMGIEFRCSYLLSDYSLSKVGEHLQKYKCNKMVGDLDYRLIRHSKTPLTDKEIGYVFNDGLVVMSYIQEQIENHGNNITRIPLTKTGEIRNLCRKNCLYGGKRSHKNTAFTFNNYRRIMKADSIRSVDEYLQLRNRVFMGGFTHANAFYNNVTVRNVTSFDFTSAYPYVMVSEKFPYGRCELVKVRNKEELEHNLNCYCCMFDVVFIGLEDVIKYEHPLSLSHCRIKENVLTDNGRVVRADKISTSLTDVDYEYIRKFYKWEHMMISNFRRYKRAYLPTPFVETILQLYQNKTTLKGVEDKESEYLNSKELLNSCYGMTVTDICRPEIIYENGEWKVKPIENEDYEKLLQDYNNKRNRFLSYAWGVWVTAYNRRNLFTGIYNAGMNYIYSDTDSLKLKLTPEIQQYIERYNSNVIEKLKRAMNHHKLPFDMCCPKTINGDIKTLGVWENETPIPYKRFKTLGAKRYMVEYPNGKISLTVSGINKKTAIPYLQTLNKDLFDLFEEGMTVKGEYESNGLILEGTGKKIHTYIDTPQDGIITDYLGNKFEFHELSSVHIESSDYTLSYGYEYLEYLLYLKVKENKQ